MRKSLRVAATIAAAAALAGPVLTGAWAKAPTPAKDLSRTTAKRYTTVNALQVNDVLRVKKNTSVYGTVYAHNSEQIWKGLSVRDGLKADSINDAGPLQAQTATIINALQAGAITGTSITATGNGNVGGALSVHDKVTGNGVDAGASGLTTSGNIAAGGTLSAQGAATFSGGMTVSGNVNFQNATVTGLSAGAGNLNNATVTQLTVGTQSGTTAPLTLAANGKTVAVGVNTSGAVTADNLAVSGGLTVGGTVTVVGSNGISTGAVSAPAGGGGALGALTLQGSTINLNGTVNLGNQGDLTLSQSSSGASHILANNDGDVAGVIKDFSIPAGTVQEGGYTYPVQYAKPYANEPAVNVTPTADLNPGNATPSKYWVTPNTNANGQYTGFTVHLYPPQSGVATRFTATFYYTVVGTGK